ncbi:MAG: potassium-transporting ATPase subunit KdpC [Acidobacteriota bacterium]
MKNTLKTAFLMLIAMTLITGIVYPLVVTGISQLTLRDKANGSMLKVNSELVGSTLIGQKFSSPRYFHGRPSNAGDGYDALASGASNLGPTNKQLIQAVYDRTQSVRAENGLESGAEVPADIVTSSGSGLDPDISPDSAYLQVPRVAHERGMTVQSVRTLVDESIDGRQLGIFGEPRVNVLKLNLLLDKVPDVSRK